MHSKWWHQHMRATLAHCLHKGKRLEREDVCPPARERAFQKCAFSNEPSPCWHHHIWHFVDFVGHLPWPFAFHISHFTFILTIHFTFDLHCPVISSLPSCTFTLTFTWLLQFDSSGNLTLPLDFLHSSSLYLSWKFQSHLGFTFALTMPHGIVVIPTQKVAFHLL